MKPFCDNIMKLYPLMKQRTDKNEINKKHGNKKARRK